MSRSSRSLKTSLSFGIFLDLIVDGATVVELDAAALRHQDPKRLGRVVEGDDDLLGAREDLALRLLRHGLDRLPGELVGKTLLLFGLGLVGIVLLLEIVVRRVLALWLVVRSRGVALERVVGGRLRRTWRLRGGPVV